MAKTFLIVIILDNSGTSVLYCNLTVTRDVAFLYNIVGWMAMWYSTWLVT